MNGVRYRRGIERNASKAMHQRECIEGNALKKTVEKKPSKRIHRRQCIEESPSKGMPERYSEKSCILNWKNFDGNMVPIHRRIRTIRGLENSKFLMFEAARHTNHNHKSLLGVY